MKTGFADLPLHPGKCPPWLFSRMKKLSGLISEMIISEYGKDGFLRRISNPFFFQSFGCLVGFDWHSSGLSTTLCGALKESLHERDLGVKFLGGKGNASKKVPEEIFSAGKEWSLSENKISNLIYSSRISAKVDNSLIQDGYQLYHHSFIITEEGKWAVVQQGLNHESGYARRYHWLSEEVNSFIIEPHTAICCDERKDSVLNLISKESEDSRRACLDLVKEKPENMKNALLRFSQLKKEKSEKRIKNKTRIIQYSLNDFGFVMERNHEIDLNLYNRLIDLHEFQPKNFEELVMFKGIGPKTIRSLALISELLYGASPSWKDPVKYSFALGGKDGYPYPINKRDYDKTIEILEDAVNNSDFDSNEKRKALSRLRVFYNKAIN